MNQHARQLARDSKRDNNCQRDREERVGTKMIVVTTAAESATANQSDRVASEDDVAVCWRSEDNRCYGNHLSKGATLAWQRQQHGLSEP